MRISIDEMKRKKGAEGGVGSSEMEKDKERNGDSEVAEKERETMESREGGNVILQFILEE